ncbi:MAG: hypothetical protein ACRCX8_05285 [Sarcina sp.]
MCKSPCLSCEDRKYLCHSNCDVYLTFKNDLNSRKELVANARKIDNEFYGKKTKIN